MTLSFAWHNYQIIGDEETCVIRSATNDEYDHGLPSGSASWSQVVKRKSEQESALDRAKRITGQSRIGTSGVVVRVEVNGERY